MSTVNPTDVAPATQPTSTDSATNPQNKTQDAFGKDSFMKLLVEQLRNQSPDSSQDPNQFMNQMTQFSILEQLQNQSGIQQQQNAAGLLGRTVSYMDAKGHSVDGVVVESVDFSGGTPTLTVGGQVGIAPAQVYKVQ